MKRFLILVLIGAGVSALAGSSKAQSPLPNGTGTYSWMPWGARAGGVETLINHLNRMVGHMRWQITRYHGDPSLRRDFAHIRRDVDGVNLVYKRGGYDRRQLRREIENLHERLHQLEVRMHVRTRDYYNWR